ncbi:MAG: thioredoxin fold domain-containing protein [Pseudomonadota bacterium]
MPTDCPLPSRRRVLRWVALVAAPLWVVARAAAAAEDDWAANPDAARAARLWARIGQASWVAEGNGPRIVYVFVDPNCPFSHKLYLATRSVVGRDGLQLRWIIVGTLHASSPGKAAAILASPDPLAAFRYNENDWDFSEIPGGGIRPLANPGAAVRHKLQVNAALMHGAGLDSFPVMLYRTANGRAHLINGLLPDSTLAEVLRRAR